MLVFLQSAYISPKHSLIRKSYPE